MPAVSVENPAGMEMKRWLRQVPAPAFTLRFVTSAVARDPNVIADFSSRGPNVDLRIKPDLVAVGDSLYLATQTSNRQGALFDPSGYQINAAGTSFSAPLVAGAAAVVKATRPGLTAAQYRSLLVNSATPLISSAGPAFPLQSTGAGTLNLEAAMRNTIAATPVSVSFGAGGGADVNRTVSITNLAATDDTFSLVVTPSTGIAPSLELSTLRLAAGASASVALRMPASEPAEGQAQGYLRIRGTRSDVETLVAYWYAFPDQVPADIAVLSAPGSGSAGALQRIIFRVVDRSGLAILTPPPVVSVAGGSGAVENLVSDDLFSPGSFIAVVRLGLADSSNIFEIRAGAVSTQVSISGF
jgi:hypothetical protein